MCRSTFSLTQLLLQKMLVDAEKALPGHGANLLCVMTAMGNTGPVDRTLYGAVRSVLVASVSRCLWNWYRREWLRREARSGY